MKLSVLMPENKIKILLCCHKNTTIPNDDIFLPIHVGSAISESKLEMQRDDEINGSSCDNISAKNQSYCELTAMYWAWKNIRKIYPNLEYIGLNHYRRFFSFDDKNIFTCEIFKKEQDVESYKVNKILISNCLKKGYILQAKEETLPYSNYTEYCLGHNSDDIRILRKVVHDLYSDYDEAFYETLIRSNKIAHFNIFLMSMTDYDEYCRWLFDILFECEKRIDISNYNKYQKRIWGFMAERLYNVWIFKNKKKTKTFNIVRFDDLPHNKNTLKLMLISIRTALSFFFVKPVHKNKGYDDEKHMKLIGQ